MSLENLSDESLLRMYNSIRDQVMADASTGTHFVGEAAKQRAEDLRREIERRGLYCSQIEWP